MKALILSVFLLVVLTPYVIMGAPIVKRSTTNCGENPLLSIVNATKTNEITFEDVRRYLTLHANARKEMSDRVRSYEECLRLADDGLRF